MHIGFYGLWGRGPPKDAEGPEGCFRGWSWPRRSGKSYKPGVGQKYRLYLRKLIFTIALFPLDTSMLHWLHLSKPEGQRQLKQPGKIKFLCREKVHDVRSFESYRQDFGAWCSDFCWLHSCYQEGCVADSKEFDSWISIQSCYHRVMSLASKSYLEFQCGAKGGS